MSAEIPTPSYEEMTPEQRSLATIHGVNQLIRQMQTVLETKNKVDNCPHCQHPEKINEEIAGLRQSETKNRLFLVILITVSSGATTGLTKLVEVLSK